MNFLKKIDQFGVSFKPNLNSDESEFKSVIGGIVSLIVYLAGFIYFLFILWQWQISKVILPQVSNNNSVVEFIQYQLVDNPLKLFLLSGTPNGLNPFDKSRNILIPAFIQTKDSIELEEVSLLPTQQPNPYGFNNSYFTLENISIENNLQSLQIQSSYLIFITICDPSNPQEGIVCAPQEEIDAFLEQPLSFKFQLTYGEYNTNKRDMQSYTKDLDFICDGNQMLYVQLSLFTGTALVDEGLMFSSKTQYSSIISAYQDSQIISRTVSQNLFGKRNCFGIYLTVDNLQQQKLITYIKLGSILAEVGSIISILMLVKYLIIAINSFNLDQSLVDQIIGFYYPQYKSLKITRNYKNKITMVQSQDLKTFYQTNQIQDIYEQGREAALKKLNILNLVYEISRIQIVLLSLQQRQQITQSHYDGINIKLQCQFESTSFQDVKEVKEDLNLLEGDMQILCIPNKLLQEELKPVQFNLIENKFKSHSETDERNSKLNIHINDNSKLQKIEIVEELDRQNSFSVNQLEKKFIEQK